MTAKRKVLFGFAAVAGLYLIASLVTVAVGGHRLRPLYEGIGPSAPYRWVHPPPAFESTNTRPVAVSETFAITSTGSPEEPAGSGDGQIELTLPAGAIPPVPRQDSVLVSVTPTDPAKLGRLPAGLYSDGNAYLITVTYQPSGKRLNTAAKPIDAVIRTPLSSAALLASADGKTWTRILDQHIPSQAAIATTYTDFGYLLTAANVPVVPPSSSSGSSVLLLVALGLAAVLLLGLSAIWTGKGRRGGRS